MIPFYIYADLLICFFIFFCLDLFINSFSICMNKEQQLPYKILFLLLRCVISVIPDVPYFTLIIFFLDFLYILIICIGPFRLRFFTFIKYELFYYISSVAIALLQTVLTMDINIYATNKLYAEHTHIIGNFLLYVILCMYIIFKRLSLFPSGKTYKRYFLGITMLSILLLFVCSMILGSTIINQEDIVPLLFSMLLIITLLCISVFKKVIRILEENTLTKIEVQANALQQDYYDHVQEGLKNLSLLRHDFKNHLIILKNFATSGKIDELEKYISRIGDELNSSQLVTTPSPLLSSLINAKNEECKRKGITLTFEQDFPAIYIDDLHMVTILSNLIDNAISAAAKRTDGFIQLNMLQIDSYLQIECTNNHREEIIETNNRFQTTKTTQKEIHGLGILSVQRAVKQLNGDITISHTDDTFHVDIYVPNYA